MSDFEKWYKQYECRAVQNTGHFKYPTSALKNTLLLTFTRNIEHFFEINFAIFTNIEVERFANLWITAWFKSWIVAFPIVLIVAPLTQLFDGKLVVGATR